MFRTIQAVVSSDVNQGIACVLQVALLHKPHPAQRGAQAVIAQRQNVCATKLEIGAKGRLRVSREALFESLSTDQLSGTPRFLVGEIMADIEQLELRIQRMDAYLLEALQAWWPQLNLLQTIPGMDVQGAAMSLVEIGADMSAFGSTERLASWVGMCPGNNESAGERKSGRIRKDNAWVRWLLCEFAQAAARTRCVLKS